MPSFQCDNCKTHVYVFAMVLREYPKESTESDSGSMVLMSEKWCLRCVNEIGQIESEAYHKP